MPNSYRIRTQVGVDKYINVNLDQDFEFLEILSLKIQTADLYTRFCSDYGVVVGRVLVNGGFGVPNARVSVFLPLEEGDELNPIISELYPYRTITDRNLEGYRYNLLPSAPSYSKHTNTGTFPTREDVLLDQSWIEVYDKYYRFTVKTNESGDFMIFGVPTGDQLLVMDVDLSDIGCFSLNPQDLIIQGVATAEQVNGSQFRSSTNLDELPQIQNLNFNVDVRPLWGDEDQCQIGITRVDFDLTKLANIKIQPSSVFIGSIMSTTDDDSVSAIFSSVNSATGLGFGSQCKPKNNTGNLCDLITGPGQILAIRQTIFSDPNGFPLLEPFSFADGGKVIDDNGAFVVNVPMNLDYLTTDEFGNQVISNDPNIGVPTKGKYRFKIKWINEQGLSNSYMRASYLVPNVKEHGWYQPGSIDPLESFQGVEFDLVYPPGTLSQSYTVPFDLGITNITTENIESYSLTINGNPYFGTLNSIPVLSTDVLNFTIVPIDPAQQSTITFVYYVQDLFDLIRSYSFSLDWDDYVDPLSAVNCEDTFYEFNFNKVYTTAMFIDRYKNGFGRGKHLGIKEIDDRTCKTTTNTYPVNDIIRNFDFLFFAFNILLNILTPVFTYVLFIGHLAFWIIEKINEESPLLQRLPLPMINYPECTACECDCNTGENNSVIPGTGIFAPMNNHSNYVLPQSFIQNSNPQWPIAFVNSPGNAVDDLEGNANQCDSPTNPNEDYFSSLEALELNGHISSAVSERARRDFYKIFAGYDYTVAETDDISLISPSFTNTPPGYGDIWLQRAPQAYLYSAQQRNAAEDFRYWAYPIRSTLPQRLNDFNLRATYFTTSTANNRVVTTVNPSLGSQSFTDQLLVIVARPGTLSQMGIGEIVTFQDPRLSPSNVLLTGATLNQFNTRAVTGTTTLGQQSKIIYYANPNSITNTTPSQANIVITQASKYGNTNLTQESDYLRYATDLEYFQVVTGVTYSQFLSTQNPSVLGFRDFLLSSQRVRFPNCNTNFNDDTGYDEQTLGFTMGLLSDNSNYEIIFLTRGVDPHTDKQTIRYDLSLYFGNTANTNVVEGSYYLNIPIQTYPNPQYPKSHIQSNQSFGNFAGLYFNSFTFTITPSNYTGFSSTMPYYYLCTDESFVDDYFPESPGLNYPTIASLTNSNQLYLNGSDYLLPLGASHYIGGGSFIAVNNNSFDFEQKTSAFGNNAQAAQYFANNSLSTPTDYFYRTAVLYSPAYINYYIGNITTQNGGVYNEVGFVDSANILMRSDRLPTSTNLETPNGVYDTSSADFRPTSFALHQNTNFTFYRYENLGGPINLNLQTGSIIELTEDQNDVVSGLTETLDCEGMVSLQCYTGTGVNIGVNPDCDQTNVVNGCYCLLNPVDGEYLINGAYRRDLQLLLEWKARFTLTFAACRGVFAQVFQNNWVNGNLYMFSFVKKTTFLQGNPNYRYCKDIAVFNPISNSFFYRSSPYNNNTNSFVGKNKPSQLSTAFSYGYNEKQILFPTTIVDLGPRDSFIREICCNDNFGSYYVDQVKSTSYQDNSDIIQIGFLSRILDNTTLSSLLPGGDSEGLGIGQFFDNVRGGDRIDGDFSQMLSINSEWKITPFISDNVDSSNQVFIGKSNPSSSSSKPVFGVFFNLSDDSVRYRKIMSPGIETYSTSPVLIEENFGYPNSQEVPFYKWQISQASVIFGSENNNWYTDTIPSTGSFFSKKYQELDFLTPNEKYTTTTTKLGYITNYYSNGTPNPNSSNVTNGTPGGNPILVGAPYHFYFGLYNGKTALDIFYKLYVQVQD